MLIITMRTTALEKSGNKELVDSILVRLREQSEVLQECIIAQCQPITRHTICTPET